MARKKGSKGPVIIYFWGGGGSLIFERQVRGGSLLCKLYLGEGSDFFFKRKTLPSVSNDFYIKFLILKLMFALSHDVKTMVLTKDSSQYSSMASNELFSFQRLYFDFALPLCLNYILFFALGNSQTFCQ